MPQVVRVSLQTNGVLLDADWLDMFDALCPDLRIGISSTVTPRAMPGVSATTASLCTRASPPP